MSKYTRNQAILSKIETTYGSDPTPTLANGLLIGTPNFSVNGRKVDRDFLRGTFSKFGHIVGEKTTNVKFSTELKGSGVVGTAPQFAPNLRACGLRQDNITAFKFTNASGTFIVDEIVTGGTSNCICKLEAIMDDHLMLDVATVDLTVDSTTGFAVGSIVTGDKSGATGKIIQIPDATSLILSQVTGTFNTNDDNLADGTTGATANVGAVGAVAAPQGDETLTGGTSGATCDGDFAAEADLTISNVVGTFVVGETVTATPSGGIGVILSLPDATSMYLITLAGGPITDADVLTGGTSGATADCDGNLSSGIDVYQPGFMWEPRSRDFESCAQYFFVDGIKFSMLGCRGTCDIDLTVGDYPKLNLDMTGNFAVPSDTALGGTPTVNENAPPQVLGVDLEIGDFATPVAEKLTFDFSTTVSPKRSLREADGIAEIAITGRDPKGTIDPDVETLATFNPWTIWDNATKVTVKAAVGATYGNRLLLYAAECQFDNPTFQDRDGVQKYNIPFVPTGSDNEVKLFIF